MRLRKMEQEEHGRTRALWEAVFPEDTKAFLDYYYFIKTKGNEIYVIEEDQGIRAMIQLNPYLLQMEDIRFTGSYLIAVATEPKYRKRGYMGMLLKKTMQDLYDRGDLFTFLVPAAESIYTPYDFRFVYDQAQEELPGLKMQPGDRTVRGTGQPEGDTGQKKHVRREDRISLEPQTRRTGLGDVTFADAALSDGGRMAAFFQEHFAADWQVYAVRDEEYYQSLLLERQSEEGGIMLLQDAGELVGMFSYMKEDGLEIVEPLYLDKYEKDFQDAVLRLHEAPGKPVRIYGRPEGAASGKPTVMARILRLEKLLAAMKVRPGEQIHCSFAVLDAVLPQNGRIWLIQGNGDHTKKGGITVQETEDSEGVLTIGALTSLLFGYHTVEEVEAEEHVILTRHLKEELKKLCPLNKIFLNELV